MEGTFGFILHPVSMEFVFRFEPKIMGKTPGLIKKVLEWTPPFKLSDIKGVKSKTGKEISGWFIGYPLLPEQMLQLGEQKVIEGVIQACKVAQDLGAKIVGLGAFTGIVGGGGVEIAKNVDIAVTTGNTFTVAVAIDGTKIASEMLGINLKKSKVAVLGATGSIGKVCSKLLASEVKCLVLIGRSQERIDDLVADIKKTSSCEIIGTVNIKEHIKDADVIITATSSPQTLIGKDDIKPGCLICDVSRPRNVSEEVANAREDVLVIEGGVLRVPGENLVLDTELYGFPPGLAYACMSETMLLALEERYENFSLGRDLSVEKVEEIRNIAKKHGFFIDGFRSFDRPVDNSMIEKVAKSIKREI